VGVSYDGLVASGSVHVSIDTLNQEISTNSEFGSKQTTFTIGSHDIPLPIRMKMKEIYTALDSKNWEGLPTGVTYESLGIATKREHLMRAFIEYRDSRGTVYKGK
jgi:hypothetical protein